ncbi:uncharacterized protein LOC131685516 [Topomyia yanbarensis]|uniref:uncharacterized protein LOC131685516 n=1 Tax=Topomyia yanbarensis TaxID=2498891 RepID=UPI00273BDBCF|nr:uncharacterized protein LOC131685516 [Topomyia yanbarensis]
MDSTAAANLQCQNKNFERIASVRSGKHLKNICPSEATRDTAHPQVRLPLQSAAGHNSHNSVIPSAPLLAPFLDNSTSCSPRVTRGYADHRTRSPENWYAARHLSHDADGLRIYYQNARGLKTKIDDVYLAAVDGDYDVCVFTETWLDARITSVQLFGDAYTVYRADRNSGNSIRGRGGGVLIAVSTAFASCEIDVGSLTSVEAVWVRITTPSRNFYIGAVYIPPEKRLDCNAMQLHIDAVNNASSQAGADGVMIVLGDFNQPGLIWVPSRHGYAYPDPIASTTNIASRMLLDGFAFNGLCQVSMIPNHQSRFLDLVFVSETIIPVCSVNEASSVIVPLDNFHPALEISISTIRSVQYVETLPVDRLNFRKTDFVKLRSFLSQINWSVLYAQRSVNAAVALYKRLLLNCVETSVPKCQPPSKPPWSNSTLRKLKRTRAKTLRAYTNRRCPLCKRMFTFASNEYRCYNKLLYKRYVNRMQNNLRRNPKGFWSFVNTKRKETGLPSRMLYDGEEATTTVAKCTLFARFFSSVFSTDSPTANELENASRDVPAVLLIWMCLLSLNKWLYLQFGKPSHLMHPASVLYLQLY